MKNLLIAVGFSLLALASPTSAREDGIEAEFKACIAAINQVCVWNLGDRIIAGGPDLGVTAGMLDSMILCLSKPTPECTARIQRQAQEQSEFNASNPVAAAMRDVCIAEPTPECLITFALAYASTPFGSYASIISQIQPFVTDGALILSTGERRLASSGALSRANLDHIRWLLSRGKPEEAKTFLAEAALQPAHRATAEKLLAIVFAQSGDINGAFGIASPLFVDDAAWIDRFEMVAEIMAAYAVVSGTDAAATVEGLPGQTDQTAGFAGLALTYARTNQPEQAKAAFGKAMAGIAESVNKSARPDGYTFLAEELAKAGAFDLSRIALEQLGGGLTLEFPAREVAAEMARAGRADDGVALLKELSPDHSDTSYFLMAAALGETDPAAARDFVEGLPAGEFQIAGAQGYAQALFESGRPDLGTAALAEFGSEFDDSPRFGTSIPTFAAALAANGKLPEAVALAANDRFSTTALAFAAIALELKGGDWNATVDLSDWH